MRTDHVNPWNPPQPVVREITRDDLLTWEVQFISEGTLPPEVQRRLLEYAIGYRKPIVGGE